RPPFDRTVRNCHCTPCDRADERILNARFRTSSAASWQSVLTRLGFMQSGFQPDQRSSLPRKYLMKKMALSSVLSSTVTRSLLLATLGCAVMTTGAAAYDRTGYTGTQREIDARQAQQERRIQQGLRTGDLTW